MRFLIAGGLGYIGQVLQEEIKKVGHEFDIVDNDLMDLHGWNEKLDITNFENSKDIAERISKCDAVVNLAAVVGDQACLVKPKLAIKINSHGVQYLVDLCNRLGKKIIQAGTCSIYGASNDLLTENSQTFPVDFYGQTKYQQEKYVVENAKDFCVLRFGTAYGLSPRMRFDLVVNTFTAKIFNGENITVYGGDQWRPFVHIRDMSRAMIFVAEKDLTGIYNLANENVQIKDMAFKMSEDRSKVEVNDLMGDPRNYRVANDKLLAKGFNFEWDLDLGIKEMKDHPEILRSYKDAKYSNYKMMLLGHFNNGSI
jgi:nucleoside-diphosphate-sugar epimerase